MVSERTERPYRGEVQNSTPIDWRADGLLWLVNTTVFHPRGFALAMRPDGSEPVLLGDGTEPWQFDPNDEPTPDVKKAAVDALFARASRKDADA